jgi:hypothetical protein
VEKLDAAEARRLLASLLDAHPELSAEAADLADAELGAVTAEEVAENVAFELGALRVEDVWERSGARADGSYVEPGEAAFEIVEEVVSPLLQELGRRAKLGRRKEAAAICQGILLGLYRVAQEEGEFLDGWAPDSLEDAARLAVEAWRKGGQPANRRRARPDCETADMQEFVSEALPEWRPFLTRMIGPLAPPPKRSAR